MVFYQPKLIKNDIEKYFVVVVVKTSYGALPFYPYNQRFECVALTGLDEL